MSLPSCRLRVVGLLALALVLAALSFTPATAQQEAGQPPAEGLDAAMQKARGDQPGKPSTAPQAPEAVKAERALPVLVEHVGSDQSGIRFAFQVKERFAASPLFRLGAVDKPAMKLLVRTRAEFPERPWLGSVYSVEWLYAERSGVLAYHLDGDLGFAGGDGLIDAVAAVVARTGEVAQRFAYLFE